jgi:hypothetical protein
MLLRFLTIVAVAVWFGGFTFYSTVVIATAQEVLHSHIRAGLITQQVTNWLNLISAVPLALGAWNGWNLRKSEHQRLVRMLVAALAVMVASQAALFALHPLLDAKIVGREVVDAGAFFKLHRIYLVVSTGQWLATLGYIWAALALWRAGDRREQNAPGERS